MYLFCGWCGAYQDNGVGHGINCRSRIEGVEPEWKRSCCNTTLANDHRLNCSEHPSHKDDTVVDDEFALSDELLRRASWEFRRDYEAYARGRPIQQEKEVEMAPVEPTAHNQTIQQWKVNDTEGVIAEGQFLVVAEGVSAQSIRERALLIAHEQLKDKGGFKQDEHRLVVRPFSPARD